jgi:hypothetical protein
VMLLDAQSGRGVGGAVGSTTIRVHDARVNEIVGSVDFAVVTPAKLDMVISAIGSSGGSFLNATWFECGEGGGQSSRCDGEDYGQHIVGWKPALAKQVRRGLQWLCLHGCCCCDLSGRVVLSCVCACVSVHIPTCV